eukprot:gene2271-2796_t
MTRVSNIKDATTAKVTPSSHVGSKQLVDIIYGDGSLPKPTTVSIKNKPGSSTSSSASSTTSSSNSSTTVTITKPTEVTASSTSSSTSAPKYYYIFFQKRKFIYNMDKKQFEKIKFNIPETIDELLQVKGYDTQEELDNANLKYNQNEFDIPLPSFMSLYKEQALAPFFVFQVFCVLLWCLEEYVVYCLFTLSMLLVFEATVVKSRLRNIASLREMGSKPSFPIYVYRLNQWKQINTREILPGDIVSISDNVQSAPCDLLLLSGGCVVNEAMLTGESTPHHKESIRDRKFDSQSLDLKKDKIHIIFGGTDIVQHNPSEKLSKISKAPDRGCIAYAIKTGFDTNQGRLMRTIWFSSERVTANNRESLFFILFLLMFAIAASIYVFLRGFEQEERNKYKLLLNCIMVITSVVPPELPMELSLAVNNSLISLVRLGIYCTEPFRIPFAGKVNICCFDKTGTLTTDDLILQGIANCPLKQVVEDVEPTTSSSTSSSSSSSSNSPLLMPTSLPEMISYILAGCHSLVVLDQKLVGDPMETAAFKSIPWNCKGDRSSHQKKSCHLEIVQRFHFSSELKRMSTVCTLTLPNSTTSTLGFTKGAPEILKPFFSSKSLPENYDQCYKTYSRQGSRVLALGYKHFSNQLNNSQIKHIPRDDLEKDLEFGGFLIFDCPLKPDSKASIEILSQADHKIVMITGDNSLTACHVGKQLGFMNRNNTLVLNQNSRWISIDESIDLPLESNNSKHLETLEKNYNLCVSGQSLSLIADNVLLEKSLCLIKIFARVSPEQKQSILLNFKTNGHYTMMAGDGTNDVGALKQAHVGIAILNKGEYKPMPERPSLLTAVRQHQQQQLKNKRPPNTQELAKQLQDEMKETELQVVKLGDASIAAPFTSKSSAVTPITNIIKQGRCTLVTTFQMYKILALNSLITAYSLSVLYLDGVKLGDTQATIAGMLIAVCFLFISTSKPLAKLANRRPNPNLFSPYMMLSILLQFALHLGCLIFIVDQAQIRTTGDKPKVDSQFQPNLVNSAVFLISNAMQVATFAINYKGHPFMQSLSENKPLLYALSSVWGLGVILSLEILPSLNETFELIPFPDLQFRYMMFGTIVIDLVGAWIIEKLCSFLN